MVLTSIFHPFCQDIKNCSFCDAKINYFILNDIKIVNSSIREVRSMFFCFKTDFEGPFLWQITPLLE
jgi:hypothetical protein